MIRELNIDKGTEILKNGKVGHLGCIADGYPYVVPMSYFLENSRIFMHSHLGKKITGLRGDSRVCLQVDEVTDDCHWRSAIAYGHFEEIVEQQEKQRVLQKLYDISPKLTPVESSTDPDVVVMSIPIEKVTAKEECGPIR